MMEKQGAQCGILDNKRRSTLLKSTSNGVQIPYVLSHLTRQAAHSKINYEDIEYDKHLPPVCEYDK